MRPASDALINLLHTQEQFVMADLYTFALVGGGTLRYSAAPTALILYNQVFTLGPRFERGKVKVQVGTTVSDLDLMVYPDETNLVGGMTFLNAAWAGQFDGATIQLDRVFMATYGDTSAGSALLFLGRVSDVQVGRTAITIKCRSMLELLNVQMPRRLWQSSCTHIFGSPMCGYNRTQGLNADGVSTGAGALTFAATGGSTANVILGAPASGAPFNLGTIVGTSGANAGYSRSISSFISGVSVTVKLSFLFPVTAGDGFQILPGCDKTLGTCTNTFLNQDRFGGFPFIPSPETAV